MCKNENVFLMCCVLVQKVHDGAKAYVVSPTQRVHAEFCMLQATDRGKHPVGVYMLADLMVMVFQLSQKEHPVVRRGVREG